MIAFLFPEIYLIQFAIRKYVLKSPTTASGSDPSLRKINKHVPQTPTERFRHIL